MNGISCPHCGEQHLSEAEFCPRTGRKIDPQIECRHCGKTTSASGAFCQSCGRSLAQPKSSPRLTRFALLSLVLVVISLTSVLVYRYFTSTRGDPANETTEAGNSPTVVSSEHSSTPEATFPVEQAEPVLTSAPEPSAVISPQNASEVIEIARLGKGKILQLEWSENDEHLLEITSSGIYVYEMPSLLLKEEILLQAEIFGAQIISPRGLLQAIAPITGEVQLWDTVSNQVLFNLIGHGDRVFAMRFSPDESMLATASANNGVIQIWEVASGKAIRTFSTPEGLYIAGVAFSPTGDLIAASPNDGTVRIWDIASGELIHTFTGFERAPRGLEFSRDGQMLATGTSLSAADSGGGLIQLWDVVHGQERAAIAIPGPGINRLAFSMNDELIAVAAGSDLVFIQMLDGYPVSALGSHHDTILSLSFSNDGAFLASGSEDGSVYIWDVSGRREIGSLSGGTYPLFTMSISKKGDYVSSVSINTNFDGSVFSQERTFDFWRLDEGRKVFTVQSDQLLVASMTQDGKSLAIWDQGDSQVEIFDGSTGIATFRLSTGGDQPFAVALSPDGRFLALFSAGGIFRLVDAGSGEEIHRTELSNEDFFSSAIFSPDGTRLAAGICAERDPNNNCSQVMIRMFDGRIGQELYSLESADGALSTPVFSPDGSKFASADVDGRLRLTDAETGGLIFVLDWEPLSLPEAIAFFSDGSRLASGSIDGAIAIWDLFSGSLLAEWQAHESWVSSVAFSPDGMVLASASADGSIRLWEPESGQNLHMLTGLARGRNLVRFNSDGTMLVSVSHDGVIRSWGVRP